MAVFQTLASPCLTPLPFVLGCIEGFKLLRMAGSERLARCVEVGNQLGRQPAGDGRCSVDPIEKLCPTLPTRGCGIV